MAVTLPKRANIGAGDRRRGIAVPTDAPSINPGVARDPGMGVPSGAFDGGGAAEAGKAITSFAGDVAQAERRAWARDDAIQIAKRTNALNSEAAEELRRLETEGDLSDPAQKQEYGAFLKDRFDTLVNEFPGTPDGQARLQAQLEPIRSRYIDTAAVKAVEIGRSLVANQFSDQVTQLSEHAANDPSRIPELLESLDGQMENFAGAWNPEEEQLFKQAGQQEILHSAFNTMMSRRNIDGAVKVIESPEAVSAFTPDQMRKLRARVITARSEETKFQRETLSKISAYEAALGRKLTEPEKLRAFGISPPQGRQTLSDKIGELERIVGPLTEEQVLSLANVDTAQTGADFGKGLAGRSLSIMTDMAPAFANGLLDPDQERQFVAAVTEYTQPKTVQNPDTGLFETRRPDLPPFVAEALRRRGVEPEQVSQAGGDLASGEPQGDAQEIPDRTAWDLSDITAGPVPAIGEAAGRTPILGEFVQAPQMTQARNFIPQLQRDLVRTLQNNPRYADSERKAIESEININPAIFDTPSAYRDRLIGIDDALEVRERNAFQTATSKNVGREERIHAMNVLNGIIKFRASLGVPPRVKTPEEAKKLPPGTQFIDPNGNVRMVPDGR